MHVNLKHLNKIDVDSVTKSLKFAFINLLSTLGNIFYVLIYPQCNFSQSSELK